jgi:hypothetical protein
MEFCDIYVYRRHEAGTHARKFAALCQSCFFNASGTYEDFLKNLKLHTLHDRRRSLDALFLSSVYCGVKFCPPLLDATGIRVPLRNFRDHSLFFATSKNSPTARCVLFANPVFNDADLFRNPISLLKQIMN